MCIRDRWYIIVIIIVVTLIDILVTLVGIIVISIVIIVGGVGIFLLDLRFLKIYFIFIIVILRHLWHSHAHAVLRARHRPGFGSASHDACAKCKAKKVAVDLTTYRTVSNHVTVPPLNARQQGLCA